MKGENYLKQDTIIIKLSPGVDPVKRPGLGFYGLTQVNPDQLGNSLIFLSFESC
jgi:hypothetical protein